MNIIINQSDDVNLFKNVVPELRIGGVFLPAQPFAWSNIPGTEPYTTTFSVPPALSDKLESIQNPTTIEISFPTYTGAAGQEEPGNLLIENVYLVSRVYVNMLTAIWTVADARWLLQGKKIFSVYNKTLLKNDSTTAFDTLLSPSDLRRYFETIAQGRYVSWTVKSDGTPYSLKEIVEIELGKLGIAIWKNATNDLSYVVENIIYHGIDASAVIEEMLGLARMQIGINNRGEIYLYSITTMENNVANPLSILKSAKVVNGVLYAQNKKNGRPKAVSVLFEKKMETLLVATEETRTTPKKDSSYTRPLDVSLPDGMDWWSQEDIDERRVIGCVNVLPVPYPVVVDGTDRNPGEWVPINFYLKAFGLTESFLFGAGASWFNGGFENRFIWHLRTKYFKVAILSAEQTRLTQMIAATIREHWRKTYMVDPFFLDQIKKWETRLTTVINNYDKHASPSPVFANYFYVPFVRNAVAVSQASWQSDSFSWEVPRDDPHLLNPSPAQVHIINPNLGVFQVVYTKPLDPSVSMTGQFAISPTPNPSPMANSITLDFCYPTEQHVMLTLVSVVWERNPKIQYSSEENIDNIRREEENTGDKIKSQFFPITIKSPSQAEFPSWTIVSNVEYARFPYPFRILNLPSGLVRFFGIGYKLLLDQIKKQRDIPLNEAFLQALAKYEASRIYNQFNDLYSGTLVVPGLKSGLILCGTLSEITYNVSPSGGATTRFTFIDLMPYPSKETALPQKYIDFLRKAVSRNDEISYVHTTQ